MDLDANHYRDHSQAQYTRAQELLADACFPKNAIVLDVGCGDGKITAEIAVPINAPRIIESLASLYGASVTRTKTNVRDLMDVCSAETAAADRVDFAGDDAGGFIFSEFQPSLDAMFAFAKLMEKLAVTDMVVSKLADELPASHVARASVRCPWEVKGRVMRVLTREADDSVELNGNHVELVDGIKFFQGADWALVLPDASEPFFHIYAESDTPEKANDLLCTYVEKIESLRG